MEPIDYIKKPQVICRLFSTLFSIVVFGCISDKGKDYHDICFYDEDNGACNYGVAIGVIAFLLCLLFLAADYFMDSINSVEVKKYIMVADLLLSAMWSFLWFVCFCYLCDKWRKTDGKKEFSKNNAQAAIAFSFFSIISWGIQTFLAFQNVQGGSSNFEFGGNSRQNYESSPYSSFPDEPQEDSYQAKPFQQSGQSDQSGEYKPPTY